MNDVQPEPRDAASLVLVREGRAGMEVLMARRARQVDFAAGAHVFPGGKVEAADAEAAAEGLARGRTQEDAVRLVGSEVGLGFWVAAVRESFEETGILLASDDRGAPLQAASIPRLAAARRGLNTGRQAFASVLAELGGHVEAGEIEYLARLVTPRIMPRRFDTRFFLARAPAGAVEPIQDESETTEALWIHPRRAIEGRTSGAISMLPPTVWVLQWLVEAGDVPHSLDAARSRPVSRVEPEVIRGSDGTLRIRIEDTEIDLTGGSGS